MPRGRPPRPGRRERHGCAARSSSGSVLEIDQARRGVAVHEDIARPVGARRCRRTRHTSPPGRTSSPADTQQVQGQRQTGRARATHVQVLDVQIRVQRKLEARHAPARPATHPSRMVAASSSISSSPRVGTMKGSACRRHPRRHAGPGRRSSPSGLACRRQYMSGAGARRAGPVTRFDDLDLESGLAPEPAHALVDDVDFERVPPRAARAVDASPRHR